MLGSGAPNAGIGAGASGPGDRPRSFRVEWVFAHGSRIRRNSLTYRIVDEQICLKLIKSCHISGNYLGNT